LDEIFLENYGPHGGFKNFYFMAGKIAENWPGKYTPKIQKIAIF